MYKRIFGLIIATYYGEIKLHFKVRMCEHLGVSALTGKRVKGDNDSAIIDHHLFCNHSSGLTIFPYQPATTVTSKLP